MSAKSRTEFISVRDLVFKYLKYWKWFVASILLMAFLAIFYVKTKDPVYFITANVRIKEEKGGSSQLSSSISKNLGLSLFGTGTNVMEDEAYVMLSQTNTRRMIYELGLYTSYTLKKFPFDKSLYNNSPIILETEKAVVDTLATFIQFETKVKNSKIDIEAKVGENVIGTFQLESLPAVIETTYGNFLLRPSEKPLDKIFLNKEEYTLNILLFGLDFAAEGYRSSVHITPAGKKSEILDLAYYDSNVQRGKDILDKLISIYNDDALDEKNEMAQNTVEFVNERIIHIAQELDNLERNIEVFKKQNNLTDVEAASRVFVEQIRSMQEKTIEIDVLTEVVNSVEKFVLDPENKYKLVPAISIENGKGILDPISAYNEAILDRTRLLKSANENNPALAILNEQIDALRENVVNSIQNMRRDIAVQRDYWKKFETEMFNKMAEMPRQEREYVDIERQRLVKSELYIFLLTKKEETQLILASETPKAKIINNAYHHWKPVSPRKMFTLFFAVLIGFFIPVIAIYIKDLLKVKVNSKEELEELTYLPVLGEVCFSKDSDRVAVKDGVDTSIAELFRLIRTNLQFYLKGNKKVMLVTSSISGEGKSFFTLNLALSFSLIKNKKVVLVGLDIRNPKLTEYLSVKTKTGMTMFLASDEMAPEEIIIPRPDLHANFYFVPAGPIPPNPSELLLSDRIEEFFEYLRSNFDYIIVDTAPVGMVADTFSLDRISDKTVYLFRANYTNKSYLKFAETIEQDQKLKNVSIVINGTTTKAAYGYGYSKKE